jgi:putative transposase
MLSPPRREHACYIPWALIMHTKFKRCKRYNDPGHGHELTFSCFRRQPFLLGDLSRNWFVDAVKLARTRHSFHLWAYVIMPEHVHLLIWPTTIQYSISKILSTMKLSVTRNALHHVKKNAPHFLKRMEDRQPNGDVHYRYWQRGGGYDRNSTEPNTIWSQIEYIHANPVRRGLCEYAEDWNWSSAGIYAGLREEPLSIDRQSLPRTELG